MQEATTRKRRPEEDPDKDDESPPKKIKDIIEDEDELDEDALLGNSDEDENLDDTGLTEKQNYNLEEEEFLLKDEVYGEERAGLPAESKGKEYVKGGEEYPKEEEYTGEEAFSDGDAFAEGGEEYVEGEGGEEYVEGAEEYVEGEGERETWNKEEGRKEKEGAEEDWQEEDGDEETWNEEGTHEQEEEASILDADMAAGHDEEDDTEAQEACGAMEIDNTLEMIHGLEDELDQVKRNAREGNVHPLPGETPEYCATQLSASSNGVGASMAQLLTAATQGNENYTGMAARDTANALKNLKGAVRGVVASSNDPEVQEGIVDHAKDVMDKSANLLEEAKKALQNLDDPANQQRLAQVAEAVSLALNNCVNCLPGQRDVDKAIRAVVDSSKGLMSGRQTIESTQDREETSKREEEWENEDGGRFRPSVMVSPRYFENTCGFGAHPLLNLNLNPIPRYSKQRATNDAPGGLYRFMRVREEDKENSPRLKFFESVMPQVEVLTDDQFLEIQMEFLTTLKRVKQGNADA